MNLIKAKRLFLVTILFATTCLYTKAANIITATVIVTNAVNLNGTNGASLTLSSSTRIATNSVVTPSVQWKASTNISTAPFNLLQHLRSYPFTGVQTSATNNGVVLTGAEGAALSLTVSNSWASVSYRTNAVGDSYGVVRIPYTIETPTAQAQISDGLVTYLNQAQTNGIDATLPVAANLVGKANSQTISGAKNMTNTANVFVGSGSGLTGVTDATAAHLSGTEIFSGAKSLTNQANVIVGAMVESAGPVTVGTYLQFAHSALTADSAVTNFVADFTGLPYRTITAAADVNFLQSTNRAAGRSAVIFIEPSGANRNLTINSSWKKLNSFNTVVTNGTTGVISLFVKGTAETDVFAAYVVTQ